MFRPTIRVYDLAIALQRCFVLECTYTGVGVDHFVAHRARDGSQEARFSYHSVTLLVTASVLFKATAIDLVKDFRHFEGQYNHDDERESINTFGAGDTVAICSRSRLTKSLVHSET